MKHPMILSDYAHETMDPLKQLAIKQKERYVLEESTSKEESAIALKDWAFNMKRKDGENYKESVDKIMWNCSFKKCTMKNLMSSVIHLPILNLGARAARNAKERNLQVNATKRKDENTPEGLQRKLFHIGEYELAWRGGEASSCCVQHFLEEKDNMDVNTGRIK
ncbi:hypothetical protein ILUMI_16054 [Ignelater luminosus]|uniref:Uncharacterized protein n=1 Tax=Ignelater luminosus TaxID=2038154 RepID=A0A8K0CPB3_IGNLU|nr:hypothetical protein ILUMI_16054 [Ignelater luminosus]